MRRQDTIATGGSITGIAARLKHVAVKVDNDPARIRKHIEAEIAARHVELDALDTGHRPEPDVTDCYDEARAIALQMERLITDIGQYGTMIEQATAALDEPIDTNVEYRDRQRQMYSDYQAAWDSQGRDSHRAFLRMINDPAQRAEFGADVAGPSPPSTPCARSWPASSASSATRSTKSNAFSSAAPNASNASPPSAPWSRAAASPASSTTTSETSGTDAQRCRYTRLRFATWAACWLQ
jgi:hypothetical protein